MPGVLLIEDDLDLAATVVQYLEIESIDCDHASNGVAGLNLLDQGRYDVVLLDLNLPRIDGLEVCRRLRDAGNNTPVLMLTARDQLTDKLDGFDSGTDDYLVKPFELQELVVRIHALSRRRSGQARQLKYAGVEMHLDRKQVQRDGQLIHLSPTGWKLLETLLRHAPDIVSRARLEQEVWGDAPPDSNSLKVHLHNLRKVLDIPFEKDLLKTVSGQGFALRDDDEA